MSRFYKNFNLFLSILIGIGANAQTSFQEKVTSVSNVRLAVSNVGVFGNGFRGYRDNSGNESCEYPAGSGIEHLFESGIWIGGLQDGTRVVVSTSAIDDNSGYSTGDPGFEFYAEPGSGLEERSSLRDSPFYSPFAVSQQDYVSTFSDRYLIVPGTNTPVAGHLNPLFVEVNMKVYNFNFSFSDFVVFVDMEIINTGSQSGSNVIDSLYFGMWANTVVRNINITPPGSGGTAFYNKGGNGFIDSLNMAYCYDYNGDVGFTNTYISQRFLGAEDKFGFHHPSLDSTFESNYNAWEFNTTGSGFFLAPLTDNQRYQKLTRGLEDEDCWDVNLGCGGSPSGTFQEQLNTDGNRADLVSVGPFRDFGLGDTVNIAYAYVLASKIDDGMPNTENNAAQKAQLIENANSAQTTYNGEDVNFNGILDPGEDKDNNGRITRFILPSPPDIPRIKAIAKDKSIELYWSDNSEESIDPITQLKDFEGYRVFATKLGYDVTKVPNLLEDLIQIGEFDIKDNGFANEIGLETIKLKSPIAFDANENELAIDSIFENGEWNYFIAPGQGQIEDSTIYFYKYTLNGLLNGWQYAVAVSAFDRGNPEQNLLPLESSLLGNNARVFPGKEENSDIIKNQPYAYPDPYYFGSSWEGKSNFQEQSRKLIFSNLPKRCYIRIFTPSGDLIDEIYHDENYKGEDIRWFQSFGSEDSNNNTFSGGEHAWDLLSSFTQIISRGIYVFAVEDIDTGEIQKGKFTIIK